MDLVESCILTLILCSWTAIHRNIPPKLKNQNWIYNKLWHTIYAIFAPEVYLNIAFIRRALGLETNMLRVEKVRVDKGKTGGVMAGVQ